jgi:ABC-2 type transport system permease protein
VLLAVAFAVGANWPGIDGMLLIAVLVPGFAIVAACWGAAIALRFRTQAAGPLIQSVIFTLILFTSSYAPKELLAPWLEAVATVNPVTPVVEALRSAFVGGLGWADVVSGGVRVLGMGAVFGALALFGLRRTGQ